MSARIIDVNTKSIKIEIEIPLTKTMLSSEENILNSLNEGGKIATSEVLTMFDTDGSPIEVGNERYTSKGKVSKKYQTPYGEINIERHVYQSPKGGKVFCPLECDARIIIGTTPKFSKQVSSKYSDLGSSRVQKDLSSNHNRNISREYIRNLSDAVSELIEEKSKKWNYTIPVEKKYVNSIGISLDGTCMYLSNDGWRLAMVGAIALYDKEGERLYTQYIATPPEYGKQTFYDEFTSDINKILPQYPTAIKIGVADGAADNWSFLEKHTTNQTIDFFHACEYLGNISKVIHRKKEKQKEWLSKSCHNLKHKEDGGAELLNEFKTLLNKKYSIKKTEVIETVITYFENHLHQMNYYSNTKNKLPIGSGVIEAACKKIVKQRMCNSGMKWKNTGAKSVLNLRAINNSGDKWEQAWSKIDRYGI